jgi:acetate---CoA ligase (ADP-forming)
MSTATAGRPAPGIAIVGASPASPLIYDLLLSLSQYGLRDTVYPVNPRHDSVQGLRCYPSLEAIDKPADVFFAITPAASCPGIVRTAAKLGYTRGAVISAGFAEVGTPAGLELQQHLVEAAGDSVEVYGPNCIGFADFAEGLCGIAEPVPPGLHHGPVSIVSQSGGLTSAIMACLQDDGVGVDWCVSIGNGASVDVAHAIEIAVARPFTRVVCVYAEELRSRDGRLTAALEAARDREVGVILLHPGRSAKAQRLVRSHTASVAGDDVLISAYCRAHGVIRVASVEQLARAAAIWARYGRRARGGAAVVGGAGGSSVLSTELAEQAGLALPNFSAATQEKLRAMVGDGSFIENPLDVVRSSATKQQLYEPVFADPAIDMVLNVIPVTTPDDAVSGAALNHRNSIAMVVELGQATGKPAIICSSGTGPWTSWSDQYRRDHPEVPFFRGLQLTVQALAALDAAGPAATWPTALASEPTAGRGGAAPLDSSLVTEIAGRRQFEALGIPVAAGADRPTADELPAALDGLTYPVVVKVDVAGAAHKGDLGAIVLGCRDAAQVLTAARRIVTRLDGLGLAGAITGILVEEQVTGAEVLVGLTRTELGQFLTVVPGGAGTTSGDQLRTVLLPVRDEVIGAMVEYAAPDGRAGAGGRAAAVGIVKKIAAEFVSGGLEEYQRVEVNPLMVSDGRAVIADILMEREQGKGRQHG